MPIEVELRVLVENGPESLRGRFEELHYSYIGDVREIDYYMDTSDLFLSKGDQAFRVRLSAAINSPQFPERIEVTFKGPKIDPISKTREEFGFLVQENNAKVVLSVFQRIGLTNIIEVSKYRSIWRHPTGIQVTVDLVDELSPDCYVEAEILSENSTGKDQLIQQLWAILSELLEISALKLQSERRSYLELVIERTSGRSKTKS